MTINFIWKSLSNVSKVIILVQSGKNKLIDSNRHARGKVTADKSGNTITFKEKGTWIENKFNYYNSYRFSLNEIENSIKLEHLRHGENNPVFLFYLVAENETTLKSLHPHLCGKDTYSGTLKIKDNSLNLSIRIIGPNKNETIDCCYN